VTVEYRVPTADRFDFLDGITKIARVRRRDGAYDWGVYEDAADPGRFLETFLVDSWTEHLRQHDRITNADKLVEDSIRRFHAQGQPVVTHGCRKVTCSDLGYPRLSTAQHGLYSAMCCAPAVS
jgi:transmembrane secretion effector